MMALQEVEPPTQEAAVRDQRLSNIGFLTLMRLLSVSARSVISRAALRQIVAQISYSPDPPLRTTLLCRVMLTAPTEVLTWFCQRSLEGSGHGGGTVINSGSSQYQAFEQYFLLLSGAASLSSNGGQDFWAGLETESREVTVRRASILLSGLLAKPEAIQRAKTSKLRFGAN